jgi:uncharacterized protein (DUF1778 family)
MPTPQIKSNANTQRLEARISADKKDLLKYAANLSGWSLTDFIVNSAYEAATRLIKEHDVITLSLKDREIFVNAILTSTKPSAKLVAAARKYKNKVISK